MKDFVNLLLFKETETPYWTDKPVACVLWGLIAWLVLDIAILVVMIADVVQG